MSSTLQSAFLLTLLVCLFVNVWRLLLWSQAPAARGTHSVLSLLESRQEGAHCPSVSNTALFFVRP